MADSTVTDFSKMKVVELRKELKSRGLPHNGDKSELVARLQATVPQDDHADITLDSDEIDSDGVLEDEDEKSQSDLTLEESMSMIANETFALSESPPKDVPPASRPPRTLKRKITHPETAKNDSSENKNTESKEGGAKKIVLNRAASITSTRSNSEPPKEKEETNSVQSSEKIKITANIDPKTRLEMRAKRFGLPVNMPETDRKEARKIRFGQSTPSTGNTAAAVSENLEKFRKRAERFGQNVSKVMTDLENREKLEKRKAKFNK